MLFFWTFFSSKNADNYQCFHKNIKPFQEMFLERQINVSEWFLKDHVTDYLRAVEIQFYHQE